MIAPTSAAPHDGDTFAGTPAGVPAVVLSEAEGLSALGDLGATEVTVCSDHLRFIPCRRCPPGAGTYSTDPDDIRRVREHQAQGR